jgi:hypothetical protein
VPPRFRRACGTERAATTVAIPLQDHIASARSQGCPPPGSRKTGPSLVTCQPVQSTQRERRDVRTAPTNCLRSSCAVRPAPQVRPMSSAAMALLSPCTSRVGQLFRAPVAIEPPSINPRHCRYHRFPAYFAQQFLRVGNDPVPDRLLPARQVPSFSGLPAIARPITLLRQLETARG